MCDREGKRATEELSSEGSLEQLNLILLGTPGAWRNTAHPDSERWGTFGLCFLQPLSPAFPPSSIQGRTEKFLRHKDAGLAAWSGGQILKW